MKCRLCEHDNRTKQKFCGQCGAPLGAVDPTGPAASSYAEVTSALSAALQQQAATADILSAIGRSANGLQPILEAAVQHASRLCGVGNVSLYQAEGSLMRKVAECGAPLTSLRVGETRRITRTSVSGRVILDRAIVHVPDHQGAEALHEYPEARRDTGIRTTIGIPLLRDERAIGAFTAYRTESRPFSEREIMILRTFADQAVIAIENVRLFKELQEKNGALTAAHAQVNEALEQQTATSEILGVISSSPTDAQPAFDSLVASAARLCGASDVLLLIREGEKLRPAAGVGEFWDSLAADFRVPLVRGSVAARSVIDGTTLHIPDLAVVSEVDFTLGRDLQRRFGHRTVLAVPLFREGVALGTIFAMRFEVQPFAKQQIALLKTFGDQAVIAIENVRLFRELQEKNRALTRAHADVSEALEQQTATAEVLRVISSSPTDVEPVFKAIGESAVRLMGAAMASVYEFDGSLIHLHTLTPPDWPHADELRRQFPRPPDVKLAAGRVILERAILHLADLQTDHGTPPVTRHVAERMGLKGVLWVPMLREDTPIGVIGAVRAEAGLFSDEQVRLLQTFADQAVIAIENVRLFKELQTRTLELTRSVNQLTALGEVGRAVSSTLDLETVLTTIVSRAVELSGLDGGVVLEYDERAEEFVQRAMTDGGKALAEARRATRIRRGEGVLGRTAITLEAVQVPDIGQPGAYEGRLRDILIDSGVRAILAVPMVREGHLIGCLAVTRNRPGEFATETSDLLQTFATQSALAIQNARLFREIEKKSRELEAASRHKSEFLANMSHELRTPLNAIIGFSEVLIERMFGELNDKQDDYLKDIYASGQHLLSLINDILDLSKIEAGRMELEIADFDVPLAIENALTLVRERAARRNIRLHSAVDERLGPIRGDERKIRQVLLNLLSNAIKFTPEGGRIEVGAKPTSGFIEVAVSDTGVGIAPEDQEAVFEEFKQVGAAEKKVEGTGLGLALSRKFIELHGGKIWVKSQIGEGSTFSFTIPMGHRVE